MSRPRTCRTMLQLFSVTTSRSGNLHMGQSSWFDNSFTGLDDVFVSSTGLHDVSVPSFTSTCSLTCRSKFRFLRNRSRQYVWRNWSVKVLSFVVDFCRLRRLHCVWTCVDDRFRGRAWGPLALLILNSMNETLWSKYIYVFHYQWWVVHVVQTGNLFVAKHCSSSARSIVGRSFPVRKVKSLKKDVWTIFRLARH